MTILQAVQSLDLEAPLDLFTISSSTVPAFNFCNFAGVSFNGVIYQPIPCKFEWLAKSSEGAIPSSTLVVSDVVGLLSATAETYGGILGADIRVLRTYRFFLDGQPSGDPTQYQEIKLRINQQTWQPSNEIELNLISSFDIERLNLPKRSYLRRCQWGLSDENCRAPTNIHYDLAGNTTSPQNRACTKDLDGCRRYHGHTRNFGGFPGIRRY